MIPSRVTRYVCLGVLSLGLFGACTAPPNSDDSPPSRGGMNTSAVDPMDTPGPEDGDPRNPVYGARNVKPTPPERTVRVARVIDGDTFDTDDNERIRVFGIDSCERNTKGGRRATGQAHQLLDGQTVTLVPESHVDRDHWGRQLRFVRLANGSDFGTRMVFADHTYVYPGRNDANENYVANLRRIDGNGRNCAV